MSCVRVCGVLCDVVWCGVGKGRFVSVLLLCVCDVVKGGLEVLQVGGAVRCRVEWCGGAQCVRVFILAPIFDSNPTKIPLHSASVCP